MVPNPPGEGEHAAGCCRAVACVGPIPGAASQLPEALADVKANQDRQIAPWAISSATLSSWLAFEKRKRPYNLVFEAVKACMSHLHGQALLRHREGPGIDLGPINRYALLDIPPYCLF